jgi:hypothetical protein
MTDHPITPPPELVQQWVKDRALLGDDTPLHLYIANRAAQWGADMELEECCELLVQQGFDVVDDLRAARRPKPPSLKKQSLALIDLIQGNKKSWDIHDLNVVRRALEQLND